MPKAVIVCRPRLVLAGWPVDEFEGVVGAVRGWHQFDDADGRVRSQARRFIKQLPALEVGFDVISHFEQAALDSALVHQRHHVFHRDEGHQRSARWQVGKSVH